MVRSSFVPSLPQTGVSATSVMNTRRAGRSSVRPFALFASVLTFRVSVRLPQNNHNPLRGKAMSLRNILYFDSMLMRKVIVLALATVPGGR